MNGVTVAKALKNIGYTGALMFLTIEKSSIVLQQALDLKIDGYLLKDSGAKEIIEAVPSDGKLTLCVHAGYSRSCIGHSAMSHKLAHAAAQKMDIEGEEWHVFSRLVVHGLLCEFFGVFVEFHSKGGHRPIAKAYGAPDGYLDTVKYMLQQAGPSCTPRLLGLAGNHV